MAVPVTLGLAVSAPANAAASKISICHTEGNSSYHLIEVSEFAETAHRRHGDGLPGDPINNNSGYVFGPDCSKVRPSPVVGLGYSNLTEAAGVRYRGNSSGNEIYLGIPDLGNGANRVETSYPSAYENWTPGTYEVSFEFDPVANKIVTTIDGDGGSAFLEYDFDDFKSPGCPSADWDAMDINVVDRTTNEDLRFNDVFLDSFDIGDFGAEGWNNWTVTDFPFGQGFIVTGFLVVEGGWPGSETNKLQIVVGCLP